MSPGLVSGGFDVFQTIKLGKHLLPILAAAVIPAIDRVPCIKCSVDFCCMAEFPPEFLRERSGIIVTLLVAHVCLP